MTRRIGRWVYNSTSTRYGEAGWNLMDSRGRDGKPIVIDFMPGDHSCCIGGPRCCRGCYQLHNWPRGIPFGCQQDVWDHEPVSLYLRDAMKEVEEMWDNRAPVIESITCDELEAALKQLAERTGNGDAYYPDLARLIFLRIEGERVMAALGGTNEAS
jgi:hypothetical protein